jgi:hypothetical protein
MQTDIIGVTIGILGIVIGIVVSYYFYKKSVRIKEPVYSIKSNNVISGSQSKYERLRVLYEDTEIENFTVSKILFFNQGSETITRQDIETSSPLRISCKNCDFLDISTLQVNKPSNNFDILQEATERVLISFEYLDKNQGGVIQVIHTGLSSEDLEVYGDIKGVEKLSQIDSKQLESKKLILSMPFVNHPRGKLLLWIITIIGSMFWYLAIFAPKTFERLSQSSGGISELVMFIILFAGLFGIGTFLVIAYISVYNLFGKRYELPKGLEKFNE